MARPWLDSDRGDQIFLFPVDSRDLLPKNHLVWGVMKVVDEFDLSQFEAVYHAGGVGRPPYSPRLMVALIVYCYLKGPRRVSKWISAGERQGADALGGVLARPLRSSQVGMPWFWTLEVRETACRASAWENVRAGQAADPGLWHPPW